MWYLEAALSPKPMLRIGQFYVHERSEAAKGRIVADRRTSKRKVQRTFEGLTLFRGTNS